MTAVTATPNAEATADRDEISTTTTELLEVQALPPDHPVQITIHVDVVGVMRDCKSLAAFGVMRDCKSLAAFDDAMEIIARHLATILSALPK